jgi:hypothetical protein
MKKIMVMLVACLMVSPLAWSQKIPESQVPVEVRQTFKKMFPSAAGIRYEMEKQDYEISFKNGNRECSANYDVTGKWLETETELEASELPKPVLDTVARDFAGFKMDEAVQVETPGHDMFYVMDLKKGKEGYEVQFSADGKVLKKTPLKEEKD